MASARPGDKLIDGNDSSDEGSSNATAASDLAAADTLFAGLAVPEAGWRLTMARRFTPCRPFRSPRPRQCLEYLGASLRYLFCFYLRKRLLQRRRPFIDCLHQEPFRPIYGVPLGGIGCGSIGRSFRGEFCRFQMLPGLYEYAIPEADCFIISVHHYFEGSQTLLLQRVLTFRPFKKLGALHHEWNCRSGPEGPQEAECAYHGLYPRSWTVYRLRPGLRLICRQTSPVIAHDYKDSCLPLALFEWTVCNDTASDLQVSLTFCFQNGDGTSKGLCAGATAEHFRCSEVGISGSLIHQTFGGDMPCTYGISALESSDVTVTLWPRFSPITDRQAAAGLWRSLGRTGGLRPPADVCAGAVACAARQTRSGEILAVAVCAGRVIPAGSHVGGIDFCLSWHMPRVHFRAAEQVYTRRHVRWFPGDQTSASIDLARHAFASSQIWQQRIDHWQAPILNEDPASLPSWLKSALLNEAYYLSDSGSVWLDDISQTADWHRQRGWRCPVREEMGTFAYLEGHEYRMFTTYDVHAYAAWALLANFPKLQVAVQYDFARAAMEEDFEQVYWLVTGTKSQRNHRMAIPHDLGDPEDEPFVRVNGYEMMSSAEWRDLNPKFVLSVYRDWKLLPWHNSEYLADLLPTVVGLMEHCLAWDTDADGLVENTGHADQTYDAWPMTGISAYCAGLWLAATRAISEMLDSAGQPDAAERWRRVYNRGRATYLDRLWTGEQFRFDTGGRFNDTVMSDQLFGHWMLRLSQDSLAADDRLEFLPRQAVQRTLETVYRCNCLGQGQGGRMGLFNGGLTGCRGKDTRSIQAEESWIGVSYGVASLLLSEGFAREGLACAEGTYRTVWEDFGLAYQTPEAVFDDRRYRSLGYMRPLCVWALLRAHRMRAVAATDVLRFSLPGVAGDGSDSKDDLKAPSV